MHNWKQLTDWYKNPNEGFFQCQNCGVVRFSSKGIRITRGFPDEYFEVGKKEYSHLSPKCSSFLSTPIVIQTQNKLNIIKKIKTLSSDFWRILKN